MVHTAQRALFYACFAAMALASLAGCASKSGPAGGTTSSSGELVTDSDEPEARKRARLRLELAVGYYEQNQTTIALDEVKRALTADPSFAQAYNLRGLIYTRLNDPRLAEESFRRAMSLDPQDANIVHNLGWMQCQQGRYADSIQTFGQALAVPATATRPNLDDPGPVPDPRRPEG